MTLQRWFKESWDEMVVLFATLLAVIVSPYLMAASTGGAFKIELSWAYLIVGGALAFWLVARNESKGFDPKDDAQARKAKRDAKRRNIWGRVSMCMGHGFVWPSVVGIGGQAISAGAKALGL